MNDTHSPERLPFGYRLTSLIICWVFCFQSILPPQLVQAQMTLPALELQAPGGMLAPSALFNPTMLNGVIIHPENPLQFDFIVNTGDPRLEGDALRQESLRLIKYFLATLTLPEDDQWVNLSPYEKDRIIPDALAQTELGRDMLSQDYMLKQLTASFMYPEKELGQEFWNRVYSKAQEKFGTKDIPLNTFNKIWIVPDHADVYETKDGAYVMGQHLKVMLEEDYFALQQNLGNDTTKTMDEAQLISGVSAQVVKEVLIPEIEKEVNEGKHFANLRQIYNSMILATWYKAALHDSLLGQVYMDKGKTKGIELEDKNQKEKIYNQYLQAFEKGVFDLIKEDYDPATQQVISRKYFSGGERLGPKVIRPVLSIYHADSVPPTDKAMLASPPGDNVIVSTGLVENADPAQVGEAIAVDKGTLASEELVQRKAGEIKELKPLLREALYNTGLIDREDKENMAGNILDSIVDGKSTSQEILEQKIRPIVQPTNDNGKDNYHPVLENFREILGQLLFEYNGRPPSSRYEKVFRLHEVLGFEPPFDLVINKLLKEREDGSLAYAKESLPENLKQRLALRDAIAKQGHLELLKDLNLGRSFYGDLPESDRPISPDATVYADEVAAADWYQENLAVRLKDVASGLKADAVVMDVGAGTGAASKFVLDELRRSGKKIAKLVVVDIDEGLSLAYMQLARKLLSEYKDVVGTIEFRIVKRQPDGSIPPVSVMEDLIGKVDVVLAENMVHLLGSEGARISTFDGFEKVLKVDGYAVMGSGSLDNPALPEKVIKVDTMFSWVRAEVFRKIEENNSQFAELQPIVAEAYRQKMEENIVKAFPPVPDVNATQASLSAVGLTSTEKNKATILPEVSYKPFITKVQGYVFSAIFPEAGQARATMRELTAKGSQRTPEEEEQLAQLKRQFDLINQVINQSYDAVYQKHLQDTENPLTMGWTDIRAVKENQRYSGSTSNGDAFDILYTPSPNILPGKSTITVTGQGGKLIARFIEQGNFIPKARADEALKADLTLNTLLNSVADQLPAALQAQMREKIVSLIEALNTGKSLYDALTDIQILNNEQIKEVAQAFAAHMLTLREKDAQSPEYKAAAEINRRSGDSPIGGGIVVVDKPLPDNSFSGKVVYDLLEANDLKWRKAVFIFEGEKIDRDRVMRELDPEYAATRKFRVYPLEGDRYKIRKPEDAANQLKSPVDAVGPENKDSAVLSANPNPEVRRSVIDTVLSSLRNSFLRPEQKDLQQKIDAPALRNLIAENEESAVNYFGQNFSPEERTLLIQGLSNLEENWKASRGAAQQNEAARIKGIIQRVNVGGIDLNPALLDLQIKRDGNGVPLPLPQQPVDSMRIDGFLPVIINIVPITNLPLLLGFDRKGNSPEEQPSADLSFHLSMLPADNRRQFPQARD